MTSAEYWAKRAERQYATLSKKSVTDIEKELKKYYSRAQRRVIADFETTYDKMLAAVAQGRNPTPADLYNLDKYWEMQAAIKNELQMLGDKEAALLSDKFVKTWDEAYRIAAMPSDIAYSTISTANAKQMINAIWCADGKTWSQRIWKNIEKLTDTLNENLLHCVITGKKTTELKNLLQERFNVSYTQADALVRTEIAHIQTRAAAQRYKDYGLQKYRFLGREEHTGCGHDPDCHDLNGKEFYYSEMQEGLNAPPMHPRCRCCIVPVVDGDTEAIARAAALQNEMIMLNNERMKIKER